MGRVFKRNSIIKYLVKLRESTFLEKALDKEGKVWDIVIIADGFSRNRDPVTGYQRYYPPETIKAMAPLFEKMQVFAYKFGEEFDHLPSKVRDAAPEGLTRNSIGWLEQIRYVEKIPEEDRGGLVGKFYLVDKPIREKALEAWDLGNRNFLGFSIDIEGKSSNGTAEGKMASIVKETKVVNELTLVSHPAAGGRFERLVASFQGENQMKKLYELLGRTRPELRDLIETDQTDERILSVFESIEFEDPEASLKDAESDQLQEDLKTKVKEIIENIKAKTIDKAAELLEALLTAYGSPQFGGSFKSYGYPYPAQKKESAPVIPAPAVPAPAVSAPVVPAPVVVPPASVLESANAEQVKSLQEQINTMNCKEFLAESLKAETVLPEIVKEKIRSRFSGKVFQPNELTEMIKEEKDVYAKLIESGEVKVPAGQDKIHVGLDAHDRLQRSMDLLIDPNISEDEKKLYEGVTPFKSLKESYNFVTGDHDVTGKIAESCLREAVSTDYPYLLGVSMNRSLAKIYQAWPANWKNIVSINDQVTDFKEYQANRWGGFTKLSAVTEDAVFATIATPQEEKATYTPDQYGGQFYVTRKMIKNDDLRMVRQIPAKANRAASSTLDQFVFDLLLGYTIAGGINAATIFDGKVIYHADHFNIGSVVIGYDSIQAGINAMMEQWEYGALDALNEALDDSETDIDVDTGTKFKVGDYFLVDAEILGPISVIATNTLTAARGALGTTAATHLDNAPVSVLTDQLGTKPKYLVHPVDIRESVEQYLQNPEKPLTADRDMNMIKGYGIQPLTIPKTRARGDANNWFFVADPMILPSIEVGFVDNRQVPELLIQSAPTTGATFTHQRITYRILHEYGGNVIDFRGLYGALPS